MNPAYPNRRYRLLEQVPVPRRYIGRAVWIRPILDMPDTTLLTAKTSELILSNWGGDFDPEESTHCFYRDVLEYAKKYPNRAGLMQQRLRFLGLSPEQYLYKLYLIHFRGQVYSPYNFENTYTPWATAVIGVSREDAEEGDPGDGDFRSPPEGAVGM